MTEQEKMKLNEKLARWVWPKAQSISHFTDSLDACFKYLVPKMTKLYIHKNTRLSVLPDDFHVEAMIDKSYRSTDKRFTGLLIRNEIWGRASDKDLSVALCLAVEKLIDSQEVGHDIK